MGNLLPTLSIYSVLLPFLTGLVLWKFQDANARIMVMLLVFASISQIIGSQSKDHKFLIYNLYIIIDVFFWTLLIFRNSFSRISKSLVPLLGTALIIFALSKFFSEGINTKFYRNLVSFDLILLVIYVLIYFIEKYNSGKSIRLKTEPMFWFCLGILFYAPGTYLLFSTRYFLNDEEFNSVWKFHHLFNILLYLLITVGFLAKIKLSTLLKR
jgi:hypothetical protein